jgi:hypothetical protein
MNTGILINEALFFAFSPKATNVLILAGLLTRFTFDGLPIHMDSGGGCQSFFIKLTAAGTVQDLHLIPF